MIFKQPWREPFVQFLGLGLLFFVVMLLARQGEGVNLRIHIGMADIGHRADMWEAQHDRTPSEQELVSIIDQFVREANVIGLDDDDVLVRRRLN